MGDDEDYVVFGTPLEPLDEDDVPRKKPIYIQDQIATDKQGRRRFHGAFTGGFSAGFYNSVSTPEGWIPTAFKSSREKKADSLMQRPEDFMDDEDTDQFGIAPSVLRAKPEYGGTVDKGRKRERVTFSDGPIPGDPVLHSILRPAKETVGVHLLMKMGWKPGQGIGPRLTKIEKKRQKKENQKVYGCYIPGKADSDESDEEIDLKQLFAPDDVEMIFIKPKTNRFGMGYTGLDKDLLAINKSKQDTFRLMDNNKKLAIRGQAFGVGAFEEEDADIYARDDMSNYDFALETTNSLKQKRRKEREEKKLLALTTGGIGVIEGFIPAKNPPVLKKHFPPPKLPPDFTGIHAARKTRFGPEHKNLPQIKTKQLLTALDRSAILEDKPTINETPIIKETPIVKETPIIKETPLIIQEKPIEVKKEENLKSIEIKDIPAPDPEETSFRPFIGDPAKQARYERYLHFIKIGAKDAFSSIQPKVMNEWEKERERSEFEQASRLYKPLSGMMADRFASAELPDESLDPLAPVQRYVGGVDAELAKAAKDKKYGKLTRSVYTWLPVALLCKKMNIAEPLSSGGVSLCDVAESSTKKKKTKFSAFDFLADGATCENYFDKPDEPEIKNQTETPQEPKITEPKPKEPKINELKPNEPKKLNLPPPDVIQFEDLDKKIDLFKAIFCSDESEEEEEKQEEKNSLRNTSPPRGIFANLDLDALNQKAHKPEIPTDPKTPTEPPKMPEPELLYGPTLPSKPVFSKPSTSRKESSSDSEKDSSEDEWVEMSKQENKSKREKKHKKEKKKDKHKSKKKSSKKKKKH